MRSGFQPISGEFCCDTCEPADKKKRGCTKDRKRGYVRLIGCTCNKRKSCELCKGIGSFEIRRCPRGVDTFGLLPFFYMWKDSGYTIFPDGTGMLYQPTKMIEAFLLMRSVLIPLEAEVEAQAIKRK